MYLKLWDMSYRRIGDLIQLVDQRNKDLAISHLVGLTINKKFIPSVANIIGTDMANYKLIRKNQFACSTMQVRRDKKMPIALLKEFDIAIISQAYPVFEVIDENVILPDYLMLWFSRSEFDREACFHAVGGVRGSLEWEDFCTMQLPVPSIEEQRQIVAQYQSIANKIKVNEEICEKLEATAQALYKHWFVDFEFPNEEGKPYKSSDGKMVWNEELGKEIPEGWDVKNLELIYKIQIGRTPSRDEPEWFFKNDKGIKWISIKDINDNGIFLLYTNENLSIEAFKKHKIPLIPKDTVVLSFKMSVGRISIANEDMLSNEAIASFIKRENNILSNEYLYFFLKTFNYQALGTTSSIVNSINSAMIKNFKIIIPNKNLNIKFETYVNNIFEQIRIKEIENQKLTKLQSLLLSRLSVGEEEKRL